MSDVLKPIHTATLDYMLLLRHLTTQQMLTKHECLEKTSPTNAHT